MASKSRRLQQIKGHDFKTFKDITDALQVQDQPVLIENLTALRNYLSIRPQEDAIQSQDPRLLLAQQWLESNPGATEIFRIWESGAYNPNSGISSLVVALLSSLLLLLSSHYTFHGLGLPIVKTILTPKHLRRLNSYLGGTHNESIIVTLKLFNTISTFAGGREKKTLLESFGWEIKSLPKLLNMRRKSSNRDPLSPTASGKPDIRTLYIQFLLSFIDSNSSFQVKSTFIEQQQSVFLSIFRGLIQDSFYVVQLVLESCWTGIWSDPKIKRTLKIGLFNETTISHLLKLYARDAPEDENNSDNIPANLVHHFLLAICTRPGTGICFKDRGWYARESDPDMGGHDGADEGHVRQRFRGRIYNKILANMLKSLRVNEDPREQELALKVLGACPELVSGYWSGAALTLEPRLSSKWITNVAFFGLVISLPVPVSSFHLADSNLHHPSPPPLANVIENIFPSVNTKNNFSKGLQSPLTLVRHCTAIALTKCLIKFDNVRKAFRDVSASLEENETDGLWFKRLEDIEREVRKRVPEFQVIISFSQQYKASTGDSASSLTESEQIKEALLLETAQRLLWMYHHSLPWLVAQVRFDAGKLLQKFVYEPTAEDGTQATRAPSRTKGFDMLRQLHILRLLKDSDQFGWTGSFKTGLASQSYLTVLLSAYAVSESPSSLRVVLLDLLEHVLAESILFQGDSNEPRLWLISLPTLQRARGTESPDGASLTDEVDGVVTFFEDCIQRCLKTPYRYIEDMPSLTNATDDHYSTIHTLPSPLIVTILEQLDIKVGKKLLRPSDTLSVATFVRKLVFRLSSKQQSFQFLHTVAAKFDTMLQVERLFPEYPVVTAAIRREVGLLRQCLLLSPTLPSLIELPPPIGHFLSTIEKMSIPVKKIDRKTSASELVDWLRLVEGTLGPEELRRLSLVVNRLYPPSVPLIAEHAIPFNGSLWEALGPTSENHQFRGIPFDFAFLHACETQIVDESCRAILVGQALGSKPNLREIERAICLIAHRFQTCSENEKRGLLFLLTSVMKRSMKSLQSHDIHALKEIVFSRTHPIKLGLVANHLPDTLHEGFHHLVVNVLDPSDASDRVLVAEVCDYWLEVLSSNVSSASIENTLIPIWLRYFDIEDLFNILDAFSSNIEVSESPPPKLLHHVLVAARDLMRAGSKTDSIQWQPKLLALRSHLIDLAALEELIAIIIESSMPVCFSGRLHTKCETIHDMVTESEVRWSRHLARLPETLPVSSFLTQDTWTPSTAAIVSTLIYKGDLPTSEFISWLNTAHCINCTSESYVMLMHAFLDRSSCCDEILRADDGVWAPHLSRLLRTIQDDTLCQDTRVLGATCVSLMLGLMSPRIANFVPVIVRSVQELVSLNTNFLSIGSRLHTTHPEDAMPVVEELVEYGLQCAVRLFAEGDLSILRDAPIDELIHLTQVASKIKFQSAEAVIKVVMQSHLAYLPAVRLITALFSRTHLKPVAVNRYLQSVLQHPEFFKHCTNSSSGISATRDAIVSLLHVVFHLHPANTCQPTHVEPLVRIYCGTLSQSDTRILSIFRLFEAERKVSIGVLLNRWSPSANILSAGPLEALHNLDPVIVFRTCLNFPGRQPMQELQTKQPTPAEEQLYDPLFILLLFAQMLAESPPTSAFAWVELFRTNVAGLLIRALSSKDGMIRDVSLCQITALWRCLETADLQERPHILHILNLLKNVIAPPTDQAPQRLPSYTTLLLAHALRGVFHPSNFTYPIIARFLLQRPELDTSDVPMLYSMLYGSSGDWKKERGWIIRFLSDGMMSAGDWRILKGRHTWDLLASLFQSSQEDRALRAGILEVLANLTSNAQATASLVLKSGLLSWIEMQLSALQKTDALEWTKILNNIMIIADYGKFEASTNGEWRATICRCLSILLDDCKYTNAFNNLPLVAQAVLRLSLLPGPQLSDLPLLLRSSVSCLRRYETVVNVSLPDKISSTKTSSWRHLPDQLSRAREIHQPFPHNDPLQLWGMIVEILWRISMALKEVSSSWGALSCRMIVWNALSRKGDDNDLPEWVRKQTVCNMAK